MLSREGQPDVWWSWISKICNTSWQYKILKLILAAGRVIEKINKVNKNKSQNGELHLLDISVCNTAQHKHSTGAVKER